MGAVAKFIGFGAGLVATWVTLKSLDRLLYSLDEKRPRRIQEHQLQMQALHEQRRLLKEAQEAEAA